MDSRVPIPFNQGSNSSAQPARLMNVPNQKNVLQLDIETAERVQRGK